MRARAAVLAGLVALLAAPAVAAPANCADDRLLVATAAGSRVFAVELAADAASRARGLMHRRDLAADAGMLFLYESPREAWFWMKNTPLALDMIFADATGRITHIHENARPMDETPIPGGTGVLAVLEVKAGTARRLGLAVGQPMAHPRLDQATAAWPCRR
ncbi:DUF192 domain-containing protein [Paracoccus sp. p4-l81]|uniref:DUF192 domain-containing protein n=1 Tax=unclassified Paracoccus (in: a-proteobacteria) TaxID=2688777 RepID=UPI0035B7CAE9